MTTQGRPPQPLAQLASLLTLAAVCLVFGGCELEETCDPTLDPNCAFGGYDAGAGDGSGDGTGDGTGDGSGTEPPTPCPDGCGAGVCEDNECVYTHVLVQDISAELNGPHPGSDIDAIELISNGQSFFARTPTDFFSDATMTNDASDPSQVAGAPELAGTPFACDVDAATEHWFSLATGSWSWTSGARSVRAIRSSCTSAPGAWTSTTCRSARRRASTRGRSRRCWRLPPASGSLRSDRSVDAAAPLALRWEIDLTVQRRPARNARPAHGAVRPVER